MAKNERYMKDLVLGLPAEIVEPIIRKFLEGNQFYQSEWHGDVCWMTDLFNVKGYHFFAYFYDGTTLHLEAWLRNGKEGEMGLTGFAAATCKAPYLQKINLILLTHQITLLHTLRCQLQCWVCLTCLVNSENNDVNYVLLRMKSADP